MNLLLFLIVGLVAGAIGKAIMPGTSKEPSSWVWTMLLGVAGAYIGGFLASVVGLAVYGLVGQLLLAAVGAAILIGILRLVSRS